MSLFGTLGKIASIGSQFLPGPTGQVLSKMGGTLDFIDQVKSGTKYPSPLAPGAAPTSGLIKTLKLTPAVNVASVGPFASGPGFPQLPDSVKTSGVSLFPGGPMAGTQTQYYGPNPPQQGSRGYHLNKSAYYTKGGKLVQAGSKWVKNRRRNPLNPRALSRSISRIQSAKNASKFLGRVTVRSRAECR